MSWFASWYLIQVLIPFQLCVATNGAYIPPNQEAASLCFTVLGAQQNSSPPPEMYAI